MLSLSLSYGKGGGGVASKPPPPPLHRQELNCILIIYSHQNLFLQNVPEETDSV